MQTRLTFQCLRRAIESNLVCPSTRDALELLAQFVPTATGPHVDPLGPVLVVDNHVWRFRSRADAERFAELLESYFRNFDPAYRIRAFVQSPEAESAVGML